MNTVMSTNESSQFITGHVIYIKPGLYLQIPSENHPRMDMICISGMSGAMLLVAITIYIGNFKLKNRIIDLLNLFENSDLPSEESGRKYFMKSVILSWFCVMFGIPLSSLFGHDESELDFLSITVVSIIYLILQAVQLSPIIGMNIFVSTL